MANYSTTPLHIDEYARFMADMFDERSFIGVPTVFQAFFGRAENGAMTKFSPDSATVDIDIIRGNERLAALITRGANVRPLDLPDTIAQRFTNVTRIYPLIEENGNIDSNQLLFRQAGENPFGTASRLDRMRSLASEQHKEGIRRIVRLFEYLASQSVLNGKMPAIFGTTDTNLLYDFQRTAAHAVTVGTEWDQAGSTPMADIDSACAQIRADGHLTADMILLGSEVMDALVSHTAFAALADNRRFQLIDVGTMPVPPSMQRFVAAGAIPRGRLQTAAGNNLWLFTYLDVYTDSAGDPANYMPTNKAVVACSSARCDRYFGPPERLPDVPARDQLYQQMFGFAPGLAPMPPSIKGDGSAVSPAMFYCDAYVSENWKRVTCRTQAAPIFATTHTDAFVTLSGLISV